MATAVIATFFQTLSMYHSGICYFCFDNFLCIMNVHVAGQFQILQRRFELVCDREAYDSSHPGRTTSSMKNFATRSYKYSDQYNEFKSCVRNHQGLIMFTKMMEDVYTFVILSQVLIFSLLICLVSYQAVLVSTYECTIRLSRSQNFEREKFRIAEILNFKINERSNSKE